MPHVRFPMMTHHQLVELLLDPLSKSYTNMIVEKIRSGLRYHKGQVDSVEDDRIYTPRLYTTENYCASLSVDHFYELPSYHCRGLHFASQRYNAEFMGTDQVDWSVDLYPKGVWFQRCLTVYEVKEVREVFLYWHLYQEYESFQYCLMLSILAFSIHQSMKI